MNSGATFALPWHGYAKNLDFLTKSKAPEYPKNHDLLEGQAPSPFSFRMSAIFWNDAAIKQSAV